MEFSLYLQFLVKSYVDQADLYTLTDLRFETREEQRPQSSEWKRMSILAGLRELVQQGHVLLVGKPGSGKSTVLQRLQWDLAQMAQVDQSQPIPVLVSLRSERSIMESIYAVFRRAKLRVSHLQIDEWLLDGRLFLLLDGINEIPSEALQHQVQQFLIDNPNTPMIITSRELGVDLGIEKKAEMCALTELQISDFLGNHLPEYAEVLLRQLKDRLCDLAETPLLLKLLCEVFDPTTQQIPQNRGELFRAVDQKYSVWKTREGIRSSEKFWQWNRELLGYLAFRMLQANGSATTKWLAIAKADAERLLENFLTERVRDPGERAKDWLQDLLEHHLLQVALIPNQIEFRHQLFQEYYAAEHLYTLFPTLQDATLKHNYLNLMKWTEPLMMLISLLEDRVQEMRIVKLALDVDLKLAVTLIHNLNKSNQCEAIDHLKTSPVPEALTFILLRYLDPQADNRDEIKYETVAGRLEISTRHTPLRDDKLGQENHKLMLIDALMLEVCVFGSLYKSFQELCSELLQRKESLVGLNLLYLGTHIGLEEDEPLSFMKENLVEANEDDVRLIEFVASGRFKDADDQQAIVTSFNNRFSRRTDWLTFWSVLTLGTLGFNDAALDVFINLAKGKTALYSSHRLAEIVEMEAMQALSYLGCAEAIPTLHSILNRQEYNTDRRLRRRESAAFALGVIVKKLVDSGVVAKEPKAGTSKYSEDYVSELLWIGIHSLIDGTITHAYSIIRDACQVALGAVGVEVTMENIIDSLRVSTDELTLYKDAFLPLDDSQLSSLLESCLTLDNLTFKQVAAKGLGVLRSDESVSSLARSFVEDPHPALQINVMEALSLINSENCIPTFILGLKSSDDDVKYTAIKAIKAIKGNTNAIRYVSEILDAACSTNSKDLFLEVINELIPKIQNRFQFYNYDITQLPPLQEGAEGMLNKTVGDFASLTILSTGELTFMSEQPPVFNQPGATIGVNYAAQGSNPKTIQNIDNTAPQNLAEAAKEIQELLVQLEQTYPTTTDAEQRTFVHKAVVQVNQKSGLKRRLLAAGKAFTFEAVEQACNHPLAKPVLKAIQAGIETR